MTDQISISGLPLSQPLTGNEVLPMDQGPSTVQATAQQIANLAPKTDLGYVPATRTLTSSTGEDVEIPEASATIAGLLPAAWISGASPALFPHIHGNLAGVVYEHVRNVSGAAMPALTPYHVVGNHGDTDTVTIVPADASDPQTMPASGITLTELAASGTAANGHGVIAGAPTGVNTVGNPSGTVLYVGSGVLTPTPPVANVQALAIVGRSHATTGTLAMLSGPALARVAFSGDYNHLANRPTLGTAAAQDVSAFATATQGSKADTAIQPGTLATALGDYVLGTDFRLSNDREWIAATVDQAEAEAGTAATRRAWTAQRVRQAVASWWTGASTAAGRALVTAADAAAQRTSLGLGDSATRNVGTAAGTVAAGDAPAAAISTHLAASDPHTQYLAKTPAPATLTYAATVDLDMTALAGAYLTITLAGDIAFTTSNRSAGEMVTLRIICDSTQRTLTFPAGWRFINAARPTTIAASKVAVLSVMLFGTADTDAIAAYGVEP